MGTAVRSAMAPRTDDTWRRTWVVGDGRGPTRLPESPGAKKNCALKTLKEVLGGWDA